MDDDTISQNLRAGIFTFFKPNKNGKDLKSLAWDIWHWIVDDDDEIIPGKIACVQCTTIKDYNSRMGTSFLINHKYQCLNTASRKSLSSISNNEIRTIKKILTSKCVQFVSQDIRSFRTPSCPGFIGLANALIAIGHRYGPLNAEDILPHRTTISKEVSQDAETERINLTAKLTEIQSQGLCVTLDLWTEDMTQCHYLGVNAHYIVEGVLYESTLCVKELDELSANADNVHIEVVNILMIYGIYINNAVFVTDRGAEIIAALKDIAHRLNCGAHMLKNIVDQMLTKILPGNAINSLLKNCRRLVRYTKKSHIQYRLPNGLKNEVKTRWNATLTMIKSIKKALETDHLQNFLEERDKSYLLSDIDYELLDELEKLLDTFLDATMDFEAKKRPTIHYIALHRIKLEKHLMESVTDAPEILEMKQIGLAYLRDTWIVDDFQKKAVFFHPQLKMLHMFRDSERLLNEIRNEVAMVAVDTEDDDEEDNDGEDEEYQPPTKRRKVSIIDEFSTGNFSNDEDVPMDEVQKYLLSVVVVPDTEPIDLCKYWYDNRDVYPRLYKLSQKYLCVMGSTATAESKFSIAGFLINERRVLLDPSVVNDLMILKSVFDNA